MTDPLTALGPAAVRRPGQATCGLPELVVLDGGWPSPVLLPGAR